MMKRDPIKYFKTSEAIIRLAVIIFFRFPLSLRIAEDRLHEREVDLCHEFVRSGWRLFCLMFASDIGRRGRQFGLRRVDSAGGV